MKIFEALYNPMVWESSYGTLSVHFSKEGAEKAIEFHKMEELEKWKRSYPKKEDEPFDFGKFEKWDINEIEILP